MPADQLASLLATASQRLEAAGSDTPTLDARLLLQAAATYGHAWWALTGLVITTFAFLGVNMFLSGLHSYGEL